MDQYFEQRMVSDALPCCEFARLCEIGLRQSQRDLNAGRPVELPEQARAFGATAFLAAGAAFCFTNSLPWRLAHQPASSASFANFGIVIGFFFILHSPRSRRAR